MKANLTLQQRESTQKRVTELLKNSQLIKRELITILRTILHNCPDNKWVLHGKNFYKVYVSADGFIYAVSNDLSEIGIHDLYQDEIEGIVTLIINSLMEEAKSVNEYIETAETICTGIDEDPLNFAELLKEWGEEHNFTSKQLEVLAKDNPSFIIDQLIIKKDGKKNK